MTIVSAPGATGPVKRFVNALATVMSSTNSVALKEGSARAAKREREQKKKKRQTNTANKQPEAKMSRQQRRRMERGQSDSILRVERRQAMKDKRPGGSAALR